MPAKPPSVAPSNPTTTNPVAAGELQFVFSGSGREYFKIWIVNLCISMASLGVYTAWAKVRRMQYFYRNTQLAGAVFDFHGDALRIFLGRLVAVVLLLLYHFAFGFSKSFGVVMVVVLLLSLPWMLRGALRFRLRNTSYRGLRFDFGGSLRDAYLTYWPVLAMFLLPPTLLALGLQEGWLALPGLLYFAWPWLHGRLRAYQHKNLRYGNLKSAYPLSAGRFFRPYLIALLLGVVVVLATAIILVLSQDVLSAVQARTPDWVAKEQLKILFSMAAVLLIVYLIYLFSIPYLQARIFNLAWNHTSFPQIAIHSRLPAVGYIWLLAKNTLLTLLSLGLYRPFAVVAVWRYRLQHMHIAAAATVLQNQQASNKNENEAAVGEGAADFLNIDLSW